MVNLTTLVYVFLDALQSLLAPQSGAHKRGAYRDFHPIPTHPHLSHSVAVYGKVDHGRPRQSQVQPCTVRYSAEKTHLVFWGHLVTTWGPLEGIIWDMSGASSGECLEHVWGIIDVRTRNQMRVAIQSVCAPKILAL